MLLRPYVDAYWTVRSGLLPGPSQRILPDGCVDIICNLGNDVFTSSGDTRMAHGMVYLVGTMTHYAESFPEPESYLAGIRFKPGAFPLFFRFPLHEATDNCLEFERSLLEAVGLIRGPELAEVLDRYLLKKLQPATVPILPVIEDIVRQQGNVKIDKLATTHYITRRQLERYFKLHTGVSPKEFANIVRFCAVMPDLRKRAAHESLADIAYQFGYYDHAHLANEIKRYTGIVPSDLRR